jgi:anti-anti-sigma factor
MTDATPLVRVRLIGLPVELHRQAGEHQEALRRELAFVEHAQAADAAPARLRTLAKALTQRVGDLTLAQTKRLHAAIAAREPRLDLEYDLPADVLDAILELGALYDELDDFCRDGGLLTLATPPDLLAYRRWILDEVQGQIREGRAPRPWDGPASEPDTPGTAPDGSTDAVRVRVDDDLDLATAPALRKVLLGHLEDGASHVVVDLSGCRFLDSTGLSLLVTTHHRLAETGGALEVVGATAQVRGVLEMSGATQLFGA